MKYDIHYACGHTGTVNIFGTNVHGERDKKIAYLETLDCPECQKAAELAETKENSKNLVELTGSEKQIAWAEKIRYNKMSEMNELIVKAEKQLETLPTEIQEKAIQNQKQVMAIIEKIKSKSESSWWIENRDSSIQQLIKENK